VRFSGFIESHRRYTGSCRCGENNCDWTRLGIPKALENEIINENENDQVDNVHKGHFGNI
jgi:hypothetical protein